jgi:trimeric autotransporter adhesin
LNNGASPASGSYDMKFTLYATNLTGNAIAGPLTNNAIAVNNGLFTTTLDFGGGVFTGTNLWLDIFVQTNGATAFTELSPRQPVTPVPYAITAESANNLPGLTVQQNTNGAPNVIGGSQNNSVSSGAVGATIGGGGAVNYHGASFTNRVTGSFGTVGGGAGNIASSYSATVGGGNGNTASGTDAIVSGGEGNTASDANATVAGGEENIASVNDATVGGGDNNTARGAYATVSGGEDNTASGFSAAVGGGSGNTASGDDATVAGGNGNTAAGDYSFAAGNQAHAGHSGSFVWADDNSPFTFSSTTANQFRVRATGGVGFATAIDSSGNVTAGVHLLSGGTAWSSVSDRNAKKNFQPVDGMAVLDQLAAIPVEKWNYKWEPDTNTPHIGPMAQDFKGAFYPGRDDKSISTLEFDGVELAAIQGLNQKLRDKDVEIQELKQRLTALEKIVLHQKAN